MKKRGEKHMLKGSKRFLSALLMAAMAIGLLSGGMLTAGAAAAPGSSANVGPRANTGGDPANGIYVSTTGNDSTATGAIDKPYKSINAALAAAQSGGTVILRGGTYREGVNVRVRTPNITIKSAKGEWAVIDLTTYNSGHNEDSGVYFDVDSSGGKLQSVEVIGGFYAVCMETTFRWDPNDPFTYGASNIVVEDCKLHDSRYDVVKVKPNCDNVTIRYCEIYNSGQAFAGKPKTGEDNAEGIDNVNGDKMTVQNNYIHDIVSNAIYAKGGAADTLIENNRIETAYGAGIMVGFDASPEWFDTKANPQYYENIRGVVRNNLIIDTGWEGIGLYASKDAQVYNNTLVNVDNGRLQVHSAIYFGITMQDWESYAGRPANVNPSIHHNIVSQPSGFNRQMIEIRYSNELGGLSALSGNPVMSNNCYYVAGRNAGFTDNRPGSMLGNARLSAWQAHSGGDADSVEGDPALGSDYMPANAQCAGMGITSGAYTGTDPSGPSTDPSTGTNSPPAMSNFKQINTYSSGVFTDVNENAWYGINQQKVVANVYEYGLMQGKKANAFDPTGNMTIAEALAIAARLHKIYNGGDGLFVQGNPWYQVYVDYAVANKIIASNDFSNYNRTVTRAEMAYIFSRALPESEFPAKNTVISLPDVNGNTRYYDAIILLFEAGVVTGSDTQGTFKPGDNINRAEAAAIISRIILPATRPGGNTFG
jgi:hypothetical protein